MNKRPIMQALPTPKAEESKEDKKDDDGEREAKKLKTSETLAAAAKTDGTNKLNLAFILLPFQTIWYPSPLPFPKKKTQKRALI